MSNKNKKKKETQNKLKKFYLFPTPFKKSKIFPKRQQTDLGTNFSDSPALEDQF
jgi:hypothetical protein